MSIESYALSLFLAQPHAFITIYRAVSRNALPSIHDPLTINKGELIMLQAMSRNALPESIS